MKNPLYLVFLLVLACRPIEPLPEQSGFIKEPLKIYFPCDKFNFSNDWVYCTPLEVDLRSVDFAQIEMNYNLRNQRGGESVAIAELYDMISGEPIPYSSIESTQQYTMHTRTTGDLKNYFDNKKYRLVIRFRSSLADHTCYISDNSYIAIY